MHSLLSLMFLQKLRGVGTVSINRKFVPLLSLGVDFDEIYAETGKLAGLSGEELKEARKQAEAEIEKLKERNVHVITQFDEEYPQRLYDLGDNRPLYLFTEGNVHVFDGRTFGVIGTRNPSSWAKAAGKNMVEKAAELGCRTIVSGLASGCDAIGHEAALDANVPTAAILPSGLSRIVPTENRELAERIVSAGGCLITEYAPDMPPEKYTYVRRDALIAALSDRIAVIQCGAGSTGTMQTVKAAKKLHRPVGCYECTDPVKGDFSGNRELIKGCSAVALRDTEGLRRFLKQ